LLSASGYSVIEVVDGAEGVAKAGLERPNIVLMDIQLPVLDGYDATRQIKALPGCAAIPIIAVSSFAMKGDEGKARASGCLRAIGSAAPSPRHSAQWRGLYDNKLLDLFGLHFYRSEAEMNVGRQFRGALFVIVPGQLHPNLTQIKAARVF
jgi:CheY-like chemotaxis protein